MTSRSEALVPTDRPARYGKQLVAHLGRRNGGEWSDLDGRGFIVLAAGQAQLSCAADGLQLLVEGEPEDLPRMEEVLGRHLVKFGTRDELVVVWSRASGDPGTEQRNTGE